VADLTDDDVKAILSLFEGSDFDYLQFESGDLKLTVSKHGFVPEPAAAPIAGVSLAPQSGQAESAPLSTATASPADDLPPVSASQSSAAQKPQPDAAVREGLVPITAPIVGTFYVAPDPQSAPFVSIGDRVEDGSTVGLIEVMKVFTSVSASVTGEIVDIAVSNAQLVEHGEVLFYIRPDQPAS
jgi:acetyl-CoA carboxylase biotin carboxyl carrier protein